MGIAQEIAQHGPVIVVMDVQREYIHAADGVFEKEKNDAFIPIVDDNVKCIRIEESRELLSKIGISGEIISTPGHSDDSISLWIDSGELFVGDLNPLYELELHKGTQIEKSWNRLLKLKPGTVYYGHAKTAVLTMDQVPPSATDFDTIGLMGHSLGGATAVTVGRRSDIPAVIDKRRYNKGTR